MTSTVGPALAGKASAATPSIVRSLHVGMPPGTLCVHRRDAERRRMHYHAERGNDQLMVSIPASSRLKPVPLKALHASSEKCSGPADTPRMVGPALAGKASAATPLIVPSLRVGMPPGTLCVHRRDAERRRMHYHAERGNDQLMVSIPASSRLKPVPLKASRASSETCSGPADTPRIVGPALAGKASAATPSIVPSLRVGMPPGTLCVHRRDAERRRMHYHAERGNDQLMVSIPASSRLKPVPLKASRASSETCSGPADTPRMVGPALAGKASAATPSIVPLAPRGDAARDALRPSPRRRASQDALPRGAWERSIDGINTGLFPAEAGPTKSIACIQRG